MPTYAETRRFPYGGEQLYGLVADVESYPQFVPGWQGARMLAREGNRALVEQAIGIGAFHARFRSEASFHPPSGLRIESRDGPFRLLLIDWRFEPAGPMQTLVHLEVRFELRSGLFDRLAGALLSTMAQRVIDAFEQRARERLGS